MLSASDPLPVEDVPLPTYICATCMYEIQLEPRGRLVCTRCASKSGSSCVFYKKRVEPTKYDTV